EERFVTLDRAAERGPELVARESRLLLVEEFARVEMVVPKEFVKAAVKIVCAGLGQHINLPARIASELGTIGVRLHAKLAHGFQAKHGSGRTTRGTIGEIIHRRAVEQVDVRAIVLPVHAE